MSKINVISEAALQELLVSLLHAHARQDICWWACPNGDWREPRVGARLKRQGVRPGANDLMFVIDRMFHGLELKRDHKSLLSDNQQDFRTSLNRAGGFYHVAFGFDEAIDILFDIDAFVPTVSINTLKLKGVLHGAIDQGPKKRARNIAAPSHRLRATRHWQNYIRKRVAKSNLPSG